MTKGEETKMEMNMREKESKRKLAGDIIKAAAGIAGSFIKGGKSKDGKSSSKDDVNPIALRAGKYLETPWRSLRNDPLFYKQWIKDLSAYVNVPTIRRLGVGNSILDGDEFVGGHHTLTRVPGVAAIEYVPMLGISENLGDAPGQTPYQEKYPINVSIARDLSLIRKSNSRVAGYDPDEVGLYWLTWIELLSFLCEMKIIIELAFEYSASNAYLPKILIAAKGWNADVVISERAALRQLYIQMAYRFNANAVLPADMSIVKRRVWCNTVIVKDADLGRGQIYTFKQLYFGHLANTDDEIDFGDVRSYFNTNGTSGLQSYLDSYFSQIENSASFTYLIADLRSAIPESKLAKLPTDVDGFIPVIEANHEVLMQIHNIMVLPDCRGGFPAAGFQYKTNGTYLYQTIDSYVVNYGSTTARDSAILAYYRCANSKQGFNSYKSDVSGDDILEMTRLHPHASMQSTGTDEVTYYVRTCGTELVTGIVIYWDPNDANHNDVVYTIYDAADTTLLRALELTTKFDWFPIIYSANEYFNANTYNYRVFGEVGDAFDISNENIAAINKQCVLSEYFLPSDTFSDSFGK